MFDNLVPPGAPAPAPVPQAAQPPSSGGIFSSLVPKAGSAPAQPAPAVPQGKPVSTQLFSSLVPQTWQAPKPAAPVQSPYFATTTSAGDSFGPASQKDSSGVPFLDYKPAGALATTTDMTRVDTPSNVDPTVPKAYTKDVWYNPRNILNRANLKAEMGGTYDDQLDHAISLELSGSNNPANLDIEPNQAGTRIQPSAQYEDQLAQAVIAGKISLFDAQFLVTKLKGLPTPFIGSKSDAITNSVPSGKVSSPYSDNAVSKEISDITNAPAGKAYVPAAQKGPFYQYFLDNIKKYVSTGVDAAKNIVSKFGDDSSAEGIIKNTVLGLPQANKDVLLGIIQNIANTVGSVGVTSGNAAIDLYNNNKLGLPKVAEPFAQSTDTSGNPISGAVFGNQPVKTVQQRTADVRAFLRPFLGNNASGATALPLVLGGIALDLSNFAGPDSVSSFTSGEIPEAFLKYLAGESDASAIENTLKGIGLDGVRAKMVAPDLAKAGTVEDVKDVLSNFENADHDSQEVVHQLQGSKEGPSKAASPEPQKAPSYQGEKDPAVLPESESLSPKATYLQEKLGDDSLSSSEKAQEGKAFEHVAQSKDSIISQYEEGNPNIINADRIKEQMPGYSADRTSSSAVQRPAAYVANKIYDKWLGDRQGKGNNTVLFTGGGTGSGKTAGILGAKNAKDYPIIYDSNLNINSSSSNKINAALAKGYDVHVNYTYNDPHTSLENALSRASSMESASGSGRTVPIKAHLATHNNSLRTLGALQTEFEGNPKVHISVIDNAGNKAQVVHKPVDFVSEKMQSMPNEKQSLEQLREQTTKAREEGRISSRTERGFLGREIPEKGILGQSQAGRGLEGRRVGKDSDVLKNRNGSKLSGPLASKEDLRRLIGEYVPSDKISLMFSRELLEDESGRKATGQFIQNPSKFLRPAMRDLIKLYTENDFGGIRDALHETKHALFSLLSPEDQHAALKAAYSSMTAYQKGIYRLAGYRGDEIAEEYIADKFAESEGGKKGYDMRSPMRRIIDALKAALDRAIQGIKNVFNAVKESMPEKGRQGGYANFTGETGEEPDEDSESAPKPTQTGPIQKSPEVLLREKIPTIYKIANSKSASEISKLLDAETNMPKEEIPAMSEKLAKTNSVQNTRKIMEGEELKPRMTFDRKLDALHTKQQKYLFAKEMLDSHPAKPLAKYANRSGELPEVTGETLGSRFGKTGDEVANQHGFPDSESARESYQDYRLGQGKVAELKDQYERAKAEMKGEIAKKADSAAAKDPIYTKQEISQRISKRLDGAGTLRHIGSLLPPEVETLESSARQQLSREEALLDDPANLNGLKPLREMIQKEPTSVKDKVGALEDFLRTPSHVLTRIGLGEQAKALKAAVRNIYAETPKHVQVIRDFAKEWNALPPGQRGPLENFFDYLDGKDVHISGAENKIAADWRKYFEEWAYRLGLPDDSQISWYVTHLFSDQIVEKEFDEDYAKIMTNSVPKEVYDPFLQKRTNAPGYKKNPWKAGDAYVKRAVRKVYMDPVLKDISSKIGARQENSSFEESQWQYVKTYLDRINMRPTKWEKKIDTTIKQAVGYRLGQRPLNRLTGTARKIVSRAMVGLNASTAIKVLTKGVNTYAELGEKYTGIGYMNLMKNGTQELADQGLLSNQSLGTEMTESASEKFLQKMDKGLYYMHTVAEKINRGAAYYGAKAKYIAQNTRKVAGQTVWNEGSSMEKAKEYAADIVDKTQFSFGSVDTPIALQNDIMRTAAQFLSYPAKQYEFLYDKAKAKDFAGLIRWTLASIAVWYGIQKALGVGNGAESAIPAATLGLPPVLGLPYAAWGAITKNTDQYGNPLTAGQRASGVAKSAFDYAVPGGTQIDKSFNGLNQVIQGKATTQTGALKYPVARTPGNYAKGALFGPTALPEYSQYQDAANSASTAVAGQTAGSASKQAQALYAQMAKLPKAQAAAQFSQLQSSNPAMAKAVAQAAKDSAAGITPADKMVRELGINSGARAKYIYTQAMRMPASQRAAYFSSLAQKGLVDKKGAVVEQIRQLMSQGGVK